MSKEITVFVVDRLASLDYLFHVVAPKIIRGRKTDYISIIKCHDTTNNPFGSLFKGINVLCHKVVPTYDLVRECCRRLDNSSSSPDSEYGDVLSGVLVALGLMQEDARLKFVRSVAVMACKGIDFESTIANECVATINEMLVNLMVVGGFPLYLNEYEAWSLFVARCPGGVVAEERDVDRVAIKNPPSNPVRPVRAFSGLLTLGGDDGITVSVDVFPAARAAKLPDTHLYLVRNGSAEPVTTNTQYFVDGGATAVDNGDWVLGFKYSNYDLVAVDSGLSDAAQLPGPAGMDIMGFIPMDRLPVAFYTEESDYVIISGIALESARQTYLALCGAMLAQNVAALVRYRPKDNGEVHICGMIAANARIGGKYILTLQMVRLPWREDEKIGRFPRWKVDEDKEVKQEENSLQESGPLDQFVLARDLDSNDAIDLDLEVELEPMMEQDQCFESMAARLEGQTWAGKLGQLPFRAHPLLSPSPAITKFQSNLTNIVKEALLSNQDLDTFLHHLKPQESSLFHMDDILVGGNRIRTEKDGSETLARGTRHTAKVIKKDPGPVPEGFGNDADFDDELDLDDVLNNIKS